jgi:hypothetical protein
VRITWNELTVNFQTPGAEELMRDWRWLLGDAMQLLLVSALGDMFLADAEGRIHWLDTGTGQLQQIAGDEKEFKQLMQQQENAVQWFVPQLVGDLMESGLRLGPGQCYSYKKPPILGGELDPGNFEPTDLTVHFSLLGQIHQKVKDLPPGTKITDIKIVEP